MLLGAYAVAQLLATEGAAVVTPNFTGNNEPCCRLLLKVRSWREEREFLYAGAREMVLLLTV